MTGDGLRARRLARRVGQWASRRPRLVGAALGLGAALVVAGCGLAFIVNVQSRPLVALPLFLVAIVVGVTPTFVRKGMWSLVLGLCLMFLLIVASLGVSQAILNWRGEEMSATVTKIVHIERSAGTAEKYHCMLRLPNGRTRFLTDREACGVSTRVGDRVRVYVDPYNRLDFLNATAPWPWLTPAVVGTALGVLTLMAVVTASLAMGSRQRTLDQSPGSKSSVGYERGEGAE
ncbi:DUF3592 domain-containing protein [Streptomyces sp. NBC_00893]|uniref:DUF3592 domain-containing protein n=1 Tax=Streptomyces sp. NBC_00893 TaxID=2975862 RepID=UPI00224F9077|nr:DUF3592 domain-containing protein [Streptomyces sp. NBC_00893]MCX4851690.1 DUF3592 domain-containing protein [Streptomyces sp. NBC_00893]